jgi:HEAT repeat protein
VALKKPQPLEPHLDNTRSRVRDLPGLLLQLASDDVNERRWAARDLAQHAVAAAPALCQRLEAEPDRATREAIAISLTKIGGETVVSGLLPLLRSDDAALRNGVIDILKELPGDVAPHMETLLDDPNPDVRIFVVNVLEALRHPKVEDWLIAVISMDPNVNVVATALDLLGEVGTEAALPALGSVLKRFPGETFIDFAVKHAIQCIGGGRS